MGEFYDTLFHYCHSINWKYDAPVNSSFYNEDEESYNIEWSNSLVKVQLINKYSSGRPQTFLFEFFIPSLSQRPNFDKDSYLLNEEGVLFYHHEIQVLLPEEYPAQVNTIEIRSLTKLWHPHFGDEGLFLINLYTELDKIGMHLFCQLIWDSDHVAIDKNVYDLDTKKIDQKRIKLASNKGIHTWIVSKLKIVTPSTCSSQVN